MSNGEIGGDFEIDRRREDQTDDIDIVGELLVDRVVVVVERGDDVVVEGSCIVHVSWSRPSGVIEVVSHFLFLESEEKRVDESDDSNVLRDPDGLLLCREVVPVRFLVALYLSAL